MNFIHYLDQIVSLEHRHHLFVEDDATISYGQFLERVKACAGMLRKQGVGPGDRVIVMLPNSVNFAVSYCAALRIGAIAVCVNYLNRRYELDHILKTITPKAAFLQEKTYSIVEGSFADWTGEPIAVYLTDAKESEPLSLLSQVKHRSENTSIEPRNPDDPAVIIFTSAQEGGYPRGAVITHGNLDFSTNVSVFEYGLSRRSVHFGVLPFFHSFGQTNTLLCSLRSGASIVLLSRFRPREIKRVFETYRPTHMAAVPTMLGMLVSSGDLEDNDLSSLVHLVCGGAALPTPLLEGFEERFKIPIQEGYGLTECAPTVSYMRMEFTVKHGTVGTAVPNTEIVALDDDDKVLPPGEVGELAVRGKHVCKGYWREEEYSARAFRNGWMHTGDWGFVDEDGFVKITGLKKKMYLSGGLNIYPEELSRLMAYIPEVEKAEFSADDDFLQGHLVKAKVTLKPGVSWDVPTLRKACSEVMSLYKVPREFEIIYQG